MSLSIETIPERSTVELTIRGALSIQDYAKALPPMAELMDRCGRIGVLEIVESFSGFVGDFPEQNDAAMDDMLSNITRVALVSDIGWFCPILSKAPHGSGLVLKSFALSELDRARAWVSGVPD